MVFSCVICEEEAEYESQIEADLAGWVEIVLCQSEDFYGDAFGLGVCQQCVRQEAEWQEILRCHSGGAVADYDEPS